MVKHFLVPATFREENGEQIRTPKYINALGLNWTGVYLEQEDVYLITVNSRDTAKLAQMLQSDTVDLSETQAVTKARGKIGRLKSVTKANLVNAIGKLQEKDFDVSKQFVMSD
jgi:hypothetical protein